MKDGRQAINIYHGKQVTVFVPGQGMYTSYISKDHRTCDRDAAGEVVPVLPDLSKFTKKAETVHVNGHLCDRYRYAPVTDGRLDQYDFYVDHNTGAPVQFKMLGQNMIYGSHFDVYVLDIHTFIPNFSKRIDLDLPTECHQAKDGLEAPFVSAFRHLATAGQAADSGDSVFDSFLAEHGKSYAGEELEHRRSIFNANHARILSTNAAADPEDPMALRLALNQYADMTVEEVLKSRGGLNKADRAVGDYNDEMCDHKIFTYDPNRVIPESVDWRIDGAVTNVKDQAYCGSCWAHGAVGAIEGRVAIRDRKPAVPLSEQYIVDCFWDLDHKDLGCFGGQTEDAYHYITHTSHGIPHEADYPYLGVNDYCHYDGTKMAHETLKGCNMIAHKDVRALKQALADGPVAVAVNVPEKFIYYQSGIYDDRQNCNEDKMDHGVLAVGYGTHNGRDDILIKNSEFAPKYD